MVRQIILLAGFAGSGKDTVAKFFIEKGFVRLAFADALKERCSEKFGIDLKLFHAQQGKSSFVKGTCLSLRNLLINEAMEQRYINPNVYVDIVIDNIKRLDENIVISDFRYHNEFSKIKDVFGSGVQIKSIKIIRQHFENDEESDRQLENFTFDKVVYNDSSIKDLYTQLA